jgi:hypothetical protein
MRYLVFYLVLCCGLIAQTTKVGGTGTTKVGGTGTTKVGVASGAAPAFVGEVITTANYIAEDSITTTIILSQSVIVGHRVALAVGISSGLTAAVSDSKGNTWDVSVRSTDTFNTAYVFSCPVTNAFASSDTVTITWSAAGFLGKTWVLAEYSGCSSSGQPDQSATVQTYGTTVSVPASTTATNTVIFGMLYTDNITNTYSGGSWTNIGTYRDNTQNSKRTLAIQTTKSSGGAQNPNGAWGTAAGQVNAWIALK